MTTLPSSNKQWRLASYPDGMPSENNWTLADGPMPELRANQILARAIYLDVAPYMRGRISPDKNYAAGIAPGDVMVGGGIGEVVQSNSKQYQPGDVVVSDFGFGWQEYAALSAAGVRRIDPKVAPLPYWMEAFGLNLCHGLGLGLHERPLVSRLNSLREPIELKVGMVFAVETYCPASDGFSAARIEEEVILTPTGPQIISLYPAQELPIANPY